MCATAKLGRLPEEGTCAERHGDVRGPLEVPCGSKPSRIRENMMSKGMIKMKRGGRGRYVREEAPLFAFKV